MKRFTQLIGVVLGGCVAASGAQAGPLTSAYPPAFANQCQTAQAPIYQTAPPPLATPVSMTAPAPAPAPASTTVPARASAPTPAPAGASQPAPLKNLPSDVSPSVDIAAGAAPGAEQPRFCMVNHKHVLLSYEFKDIGPSGVAGVEVWYTRDGRAWQKFDGIQNENPVWVDLEEGTYGIFLLARTGFGGGRQAPSEGDQPHMWIQVDLTKPVVFLSSVHQSNGSHTLDLTWTARDDNFGRQPISLYYAEQSSGPWMPIATGIENVGTYTWQVPPSTPSSFFVRVEAVDRAGNVDSSTTPAPVKIDLAQPNVTNVQLRPLPTK
jgi:hypothetical protein